jgi:acetate kinase
MGGADAICFTAGLGENSIVTRKNIIERLGVLGIKLDEEANNVRGEEKLISAKNSSVPCYVIPTNEEVMIARDTYDLVIKNNA